jgi:hypothetical protein
MYGIASQAERKTETATVNLQIVTKEIGAARVVKPTAQEAATAVPWEGILAARVAMEVTATKNGAATVAAMKA